jgi:surfeit locus 1 family protein
MNLRWPLVPTIIVVLAVATMIGLGVWQLQRKAQKEALLQTYATASSQPAISWPSVPLADQLPLFRKSMLMCMKVTRWESVSGKSVTGEAGFAHIAYCQTGGMEGPGAKVAIGWSPRPDNPAWTGGEVTGVIAPDKPALIRLVANTAPAGLEPLAAPSPDTIPNNHLLYAIQWFIFATAAAAIYVLAVRRRQQAGA